MTRLIRLWHLVSLLVAAGCGDAVLANPPQALVEAATVVSLSADRSLLAFHTLPGILGNGAPSGTLWVLPLQSTGQPIRIEEGAFNAAFGRAGDVLLYSTNPVNSTDMGSKAIYGRGNVWTEMLGAPVKVSAGPITQFAAARDLSTMLLVDAQAPSGSAPGTLVLLNTASCMAGACKPMTLEADVAISSVAVSPDGRFAAYVKRTGAGAQARFETVLVTVANGSALKVAESNSFGGSLALSFSPDGSLLATVAGTGALVVVSAAKASPVPWSQLPSSSSVVQMMFADEETLIAHAVSSQADLGIYKLTPSVVTRVAPGGKLFYLSQSAGANRYLFVSTTVSGSTGNLVLHELSKGTAAMTPHVLATATSGLPLFSDDAATIAFLDRIDGATRAGTLTIAHLPSGMVETVSTGVLEDGYSFAAGTGKLLFIDKPDAMNAGALTAWSAGTARVVQRGVQSFRAPAADFAFAAVTEPDASVTPPISAAIYRVAIP